RDAIACFFRRLLFENHLGIAGTQILPIAARSSLAVDFLDLDKKALLAIRHIAAAAIVTPLFIIGSCIAAVLISIFEVVREALAVVVLDKLSCRPDFLRLDKQTVLAALWRDDLAL